MLKRFFSQTSEPVPLTLGLFMISFSALIGLRLVVEFALSGFTPQSIPEFFFTATHTFLFFLFAFTLFAPFLSAWAKLTFQQSVSLLLFGFLIIVFPPLIDKVIFGSDLYWSFYSFDSLSGLVTRYFTFFGDHPQIGITYGVRTEVALVLSGITIFVFTRTRSWKRALSAGILSYTILFVLGTLPSWLTFILLTPELSLFDIKNIHVAQHFLSPEVIFGRPLVPLRSALSQKMSLVYACALSLSTLWLLARYAPRYFQSLLGNLRLPQILYHGGLLALGILLASLFQYSSLQFDTFDILALMVLLLALGLAWISAVIFNDIIDIHIDTLTNPKRPLPTRVIPLELYTTFGTLAFCFSLLFASIVQFQILLLLLGYHVLSLLYSLPPFRLKRFPLVATGVAALAGLLVFCIGYVSLAPTHSLTGIPLSLLFFLFIAYTISLPLKDFKDLKGDQADGIYTLPVLLGQERARHCMSIALFFVFIASIFFLHAPEIFPWTLVWATISFWIIEKTERSRFEALSFRNLPAWILLCVTGYGIGLLILLA